MRKESDARRLAVLNVCDNGDAGFADGQGADARFNGAAGCARARAG